MDLDLWTEDPSTVDHLKRYIKEHRLVPLDVVVEADEEGTQPNTSSSAVVSEDNMEQLAENAMEAAADLQEEVDEIVEQCKEMYNLALSLIRKKLKY